MGLTMFLSLAGLALSALGGAVSLKANRRAMDEKIDRKLDARLGTDRQETAQIEQRNEEES